MSYSVFVIANFEKEAKRLIKKYPSLSQEIQELIQNLQQVPDMGTPIGNNVYKIRLAIESKGKGKRGGARVITFLKLTAKSVYLLSIYNKGDKNDIPHKEVLSLLKQVYENE